MSQVIIELWRILKAKINQPTFHFQALHVREVQQELAHPGRRLVGGHCSRVQRLDARPSDDSRHLRHRRHLEAGPEDRRDPRRVHRGRIARGLA